MLTKQWFDELETLVDKNMLIVMLLLKCVFYNEPNKNMAVSTLGTSSLS